MRVDQTAPGVPGAPGTPVDTLVHRALPDLADWALLLRLGPDGEVVDAVGAHADEEHAAVLAELVDALPTGWHVGLRAATLLDGQQTRLLDGLHRLRSRRVADLVGDACLADHLEQLRTSSILVAAVPARGRRSARLGGLLLLARDLGSRPWTEHDVERVRDLVRSPGSPGRTDRPPPRGAAAGPGGGVSAGRAR